MHLIPPAPIKRSWPLALGHWPQFVTEHHLFWFFAVPSPSRLLNSLSCSQCPIRSFRAAPPPCKVKKKGKTSVSKSNPNSVFYKIAFPKEFKVGEEDMSQADAKKFLPPQSSLWRSNYRGAWHYHVAGHRRASVPWSRYNNNSRMALQEALKGAWTLFLREKALAPSACPISGITQA